METQDRVINPDWARATVPVRLGVEPIEIDTGHCPQGRRPELLGGILTRSVVAAGEPGQPDLSHRG